jgi:hypothetical protein
MRAHRQERQAQRGGGRAQRRGRVIGGCRGRDTREGLRNHVGCSDGKPALCFRVFQGTGARKMFHNHIFNVHIRNLLVNTSSMIYICCIKCGGEAGICARHREQRAQRGGGRAQQRGCVIGGCRGRDTREGLRNQGITWVALTASRLRVSGRVVLRPAVHKGQTLANRCLGA